MEEYNNGTVFGGQEGPAAPQDPVERRDGFFVMFETAIEATARARASLARGLSGRELSDR